MNDSKTPSKTQKSVLVVESDARLGKLVQRQFEQAGLSVHLVGNATTAQNHLQSQTPPAMIVIDADLHGSTVSGVELLAHIRADETEHKKPHIPVIVYSNFSHDGKADIVKGMAGDNTFVHKRRIADLSKIVESKLHAGKIQI